MARAERGPRSFGPSVSVHFGPPRDLEPIASLCGATLMDSFPIQAFVPLWAFERLSFSLPFGSFRALGLLSQACSNFQGKLSLKIFFGSACLRYLRTCQTRNGGDLNIFTPATVSMTETSTEDLHLDTPKAKMSATPANLHIPKFRIIEGQAVGAIPAVKHTSYEATSKLWPLVRYLMVLENPENNFCNVLYFRTQKTQPLSLESLSR